MTRRYTASTILLSLALSLPVQLHAACAPGAYGPGDGDFVVVVPAESIPAPGLRYLFRDGRRGSTLEAGSPVTCVGDAIRVEVGGRTAQWPDVALEQTDTSFFSLGTQLAGRLIEPADTDAPLPLVVMVHGSERTSSVGSPYAYALAAQGIRVFAYDKRGTGSSRGEYTQNFPLLAEDAAAALAHARGMAPGRVSRAGYYGGSQGGWVAPLAATRSPADFVAVGFGLVASPIEEDRQEMIAEARAAGLGAEAVAALERLSRATALLLTSHFTRGYDELARVRRDLEGAPWFDAIEGEYSPQILALDEAELRRIGRARFDNLELIWDYDAMAVLKRLDAPLLWVLAEDDREAPIATTRRELEALIAAGRPVDLYLFPDTDHGMFEYTVLPDGRRRPTRITDGYLRLLGDWIKGVSGGSYGRGVRPDGAGGPPAAAATGGPG